MNAINRRLSLTTASITSLLIFFSFAAGCSSSKPDETPGAVIGSGDTAYQVPVIDLSSIRASDCKDPFADKNDLERSIRFADAACVKKIIQEHDINLNQPLVDVFGRLSDLPLQFALSDSSVFFGKDNPALIPALLISLGADPNAKLGTGETMLELAFALEYGKYGAIAHYFIALPALKVDQAGRMGTPLEAAIQTVKSKPLISQLIGRGANVNLSTGDSSPLLLSLDQGLESSAIQLANAGADLAKTDSSKQTPLHRAIERNMNAAAKLFIARKAPLDAQSRGGETALHIAAKNGNAEISTLLIQAGANIELKDANAKTPVFSAAEAQQSATVEILLGANASVSGTDVQGRGLVEVATRPELALRLLAANAPANQTSQTGQTALSVHTSANHLEVVRALVARGADTAWQDKRARTLLHLAASADALATMDFLMSRGLSVEATDIAGNTPIFEINSVQMLSILIGAKANINHLNRAKQSALLMHVTGDEDGTLATAMLDRGADINWGRELGTSLLVRLLRQATPFSVAANERLIALVQLLLNRGIDAERAETPSGARAIHALFSNHFILNSDVLVTLCKTFKEAGVNVSAPDATGRSLKSHLTTYLDGVNRQYESERAAAAAKQDQAALDQLKLKYEPIALRLTLAMAFL